MNITDINSCTNYSDGGTIAVKLLDGQVWYLDNRLSSSTKGRVFSDYPTRPGAEDLEATDWEVRAIREFSRRNALLFNGAFTEHPDFAHYPGFFPDDIAQGYFEALLGVNPANRQNITWHDTLKSDDGADVKLKRSMAYAVLPDFNTGQYRYAGLQLPTQGFTPVLNGIRQQLEQFSATRSGYNSVLLNKYDDGKQIIGWHADKELQLGPTPVIATVNLGATRMFSLRHKETGEQTDFLLANGDIFMMHEHCQSNYVHTVPKQKGEVGPRISLTFRKVHQVTTVDE